jgi:hypothetical protein
MLISTGAIRSRSPQLRNRCKRNERGLNIDAMHEVENHLNSHGYELTKWPSETENVGARIASVVFLASVGFGFLGYLVHLWLR